MPLPDLVKIIRKNVSKEQKNTLSNGLICLKGGDLKAEMMPFKKTGVLYELSDFFEEEFYETKKGVYVQLYWYIFQKILICFSNNIHDKS